MIYIFLLYSFKSDIVDIYHKNIRMYSNWLKLNNNEKHLLFFFTLGLFQPTLLTIELDSFVVLEVEIR
jgi:hypothetical protein